jgi:two-component system cell cycle response regulator
VDDNPVEMKLLKAKLSKNIFMTLEASSGQQCLKTVEAEHPDLILLDLKMPGIDGFEVTRILKNSKQTRNIPIIHVTALATSSDKARGFEAGADEFLSKPINTSELLSRIRSLLRQKKYREQLTTRKESEAYFFHFKSPDPNSSETAPKAIILIVDTNETDVDFFRKHLYEYCVKFLITGSGKEAIQIAETEPIDIVLLDIPLADMDGHEVCRRLKRLDRTRNIQVITITARKDLDTKIKSIEIGTDGYLLKPVNKLELKAYIKSFIKKKAYMDNLVSKYESAFYAAITDQLTALYNHAFCKHYIERELARAWQQKHPLTLVMLDIDDFKLFNDSYGHQAGDRVLREVGKCIRTNVREIDVCARYGGEEFLVVLPYADQRIGEMIAQRLLKGIATIQNQSKRAAKTRGITVSIGIAVYPQDALTAQGLIDKADMALYRAKKDGKNRVFFSK